MVRQPRNERVYKNDGVFQRLGELEELSESKRHMRKPWPREKQRLGGHRTRWLQLDQRD